MPPHVLRTWKIRECGSRVSKREVTRLPKWGVSVRTPSSPLICEGSVTHAHTHKHTYWDTTHTHTHTHTHSDVLSLCATPRNTSTLLIFTIEYLRHEILTNLAGLPCLRKIIPIVFAFTRLNRVLSLERECSLVCTRARSAVTVRLVGVTCPERVLGSHGLNSGVQNSNLIGGRAGCREGGLDVDSTLESNATGCHGALWMIMCWAWRRDCFTTAVQSAVQCVARRGGFHSVHPWSIGARAWIARA